MLPVNARRWVLADNNTDLNDTTCLEHGDRSDLELDMLAMTLLKLSMDPTSTTLSHLWSAARRFSRIRA
jgi:hypothetical protein